MGEGRRRASWWVRVKPHSALRDRLRPDRSSTTTAGHGLGRRLQVQRLRQAEGQPTNHRLAHENPVQRQTQHQPPPINAQSRAARRSGVPTDRVWQPPTPSPEFQRVWRSPDQAGGAPCPGTAPRNPPRNGAQWSAPDDPRWMVQTIPGCAISSGTRLPAELGDRSPMTSIQHAAHAIAPRVVSCGNSAAVRPAMRVAASDPDHADSARS